MSDPISQAPPVALSSTPNPDVIREFNDRGALWLLEDPANVRGLVQIIEPALAEHLDFGRAERINRSFIPADLQKEESNLIFRVPFLLESGEVGSEIWVYVLVEHQTRPDVIMALRLLSYMVQLWNTQVREWKDAGVPESQWRLRLVIPVVFYTGDRTWEMPLRLAQVMDVPAELERFVPQWETLFLNLQQTAPETLTRFATAVGWALRVWQAEKQPLEELERVLTEALTGLEGLSEEQVGQWQRVVWFFLLLSYHRRPEPEYPTLLDFLNEQLDASKFRGREEVEHGTVNGASRRTTRRATCYTDC